MDTQISETYQALTWNTEHIERTLSRLLSFTKNLSFTISLLPDSKLWDVSIVDFDARSIGSLVFSRLETAIEYCEQEALLNSDICESDNDDIESI